MEQIKTARKTPPVAQRPAGVALRHEIAAWVLMGIALLYILKVHLLPALLAGLLVHELVHLLAPVINLSRFARSKGKVVAVALLSVVVIFAVTSAIVGALAYFRSDAGSLPLLMKKMAEIIESSRTVLPPWLMEHLPADPDGIKAAAVKWLREHAGELQVAGKEAGRVAAHLLIGMIIGAMISLREAVPGHLRKPLAQAMAGRTARLAGAFRRVVFAQVRIATINTVFTWLYLGVALPLMGIHLPLLKTLVVVTFIAGLIPVLGNLISNTVIVVVSLSYSIYVAFASLAFLVVIHKLEYFLNAKIIGTRIRAAPWELLVAMLSLEAAFGLAGVAAAPVFYAYIKDELTDRGLI